MNTITKTKIPYDFMPAEQHFCSPENLLRAIESYQQTRVMVEGDERFNPPEDKFELLAKEDGGYVLIPFSRDYAFLFRGQGDYYNPCLPTLLRKKRTQDQLFLEQMRLVEFELMLKQYPAVQYFEKEKLEVDYVGLAQHYGLNTSVLDLTSDIRVALFFAMCDYDDINDCYCPKREEKDYIGYVYAYPVIGEIMKNNDGRSNDFLMKDLKVIGLQPFARPGAQRGFSLHLKKGNGLKGYLYSFSYTRKDSEAFYQKMINERNVWKKDFIVGNTKLIKTSTVFTVDALILATKRYGGKTTKTQIQNRMNANGVHFSNNVPWVLTHEEYSSLLEKFNKEQKAEILSQIVWHSILSDDNSSKTSSLALMERMLMLQTIQGGTPCVEGYNSGIFICLEDDPPVVGWSFDLSRPQTEPDNNRKVTAFDMVLKAPEANSPEAFAKRENLLRRVKEATKPFKMKKVYFN